MKLYIGNKNYSSWSLRPWLLMKVAKIDFDEVKLRLDVAPDSPFRKALAAVAPTFKVPVLVEDDGFAVWDTLAIVEYLAEKFPQKALWPADSRARARARSLCAEMHAGFDDLRQHCPMNVEAQLPEVGARLMREVPAVAKDVARLVGLWQSALGSSAGQPGSAGFLFGGFSTADAYYAPVCLRVRTYGLPLPADADAYVERVLQLPELQAWIAEARAEGDFLIEDEPYRTQA